MIKYQPGRIYQEEVVLLFSFSNFNRIDLVIHTTQTLSNAAPPSPGSVWAGRPASAARCSPPPAPCSPVADGPQVTCTPWCHLAADSFGAPPPGCAVGPKEGDRRRTGRVVRHLRYNPIWLSVGRKETDWILLLYCNCLCRAGSLTP